MHVKNEAKKGGILFFTFIKLKTGLKMPVITKARIIIDINGHISHASIVIESIKRARKNQKMIFRELPSGIIPPGTKAIILIKDLYKSRLLQGLACSAENSAQADATHRQDANFFKRPVLFADNA
ncbi:MAG: hypothetical protein U9Q84_04160 [Thermodesulfobacteriota bacterium]|nr:hypothetical protein [Thermodesulfobacteriota bacterium]